MSEARKIYYESIKKPVWIQEKQHRRGVRTPTTYRFGSYKPSSSGTSMAFLKKIYNRGLTEKDFDYSKGGIQHGFIIL